MSLLDPFTGSWEQIGLWYVATLIIMLFIAAVLKRTGFVGDEFEDKSALFMIVFGVILMPTAEEIVFRQVPLAFFGLQGLAVGSIIWTFAHGRRALAIAPSALFYYKLWAAGMGIEAMAIHTAHNAVFVGIYLIGRRHKRKKQRQKRTLSPRSIDL